VHSKADKMANLV